MQVRTTLTAAMAAIALLTAAGCAVTRGQETVGADIDDATITTQVKSRFVENKEVDASAISVETLNGTVMLSGFAKSTTEGGTGGEHRQGCQRRGSGQERDYGSPLSRPANPQMSQHQFTCNQQTLGLLQPIAPRGGIDIFFGADLPH